MAATLYIVATPIGNLADMSFRAIEILKSVDYIAAEDTRHSAHLLQHYTINTPMLAYHEHSGDSQTEKVLGLLRDGKSVALISDAGTPLISDPGYRLVEKAQKLNMSVVPIPGSSAIIAALSASGLPTDHFSFEGFLPAKQKARRDVLSRLSEKSHTLVFYEAPHRILECIEDMCAIFGLQRRVTLARELTKTFETIKQKSLAEMLQWVQADTDQQRGEIVLIVEGAIQVKQTEIGVRAEALIKLLQDELPPKQVSKIVAEHYELAKKDVYEYVLDLKKSERQVL
jgi:16S rRNA (cytidine1402-2'-O)-methyltransferase